MTAVCPDTHGASAAFDASRAQSRPDLVKAPDPRLTGQAIQSLILLSVFQTVQHLNVDSVIEYLCLGNGRISLTLI